MKISEILKIIKVPVFFASLCCLTPLILVIFGLSTLSFAASLSNTLYGEYKWVFRSIGLILLIISLSIYFKNQGICTLNDIKRKRNKIINTILITLISAILLYIIWLYIILHYIGVYFQIWT